LAQWFPLDFPKHHSHILVAAAFPKSRAEGSPLTHVLLHRRLLEFAIESRTVEPIKNEHGADGHIQHVQGRFAGSTSPVTDLLTVGISDGVYVYVVRLETTREWLEADREKTLQLVASVQPLWRGNREAYKLMSWIAE
jgi:hypothetical protein